MRIAFSPALCIAIGLLLGVPPIVVGYDVVRRRNSRGPETPLNRADARLWLVGADQTKHPYFPGIQRFDVHSVPPRAMAGSVHLLAVVRDSVRAQVMDSTVNLLLALDIVSHWSLLSR